MSYYKKIMRYETNQIQIARNNRIDLRNAEHQLRVLNKLGFGEINRK